MFDLLYNNQTIIHCNKLMTLLFLLPKSQLFQDNWPFSIMMVLIMTIIPLPIVIEQLDLYL